MRSGLHATFVGGTLAEVPLAHALLYVRAKRLTGVLELRAPSRRHGWIVFHRGNVVSVSTTPTTARFGPVAYELGIIDGATLEESMLESTNAKKPHAEMLVERGVITAEQHRRVLEEQACRRVHQMFTYPDSTAFTFRESSTSGTTAEVLVDVLAPVWRALVDFPPSGRVRDVMSSIGGTSPLRLRYEPALDRFGLAHEEKAVLRWLVERPRTLDELRRASRTPPGRVELLVYMFVVARLLLPEGEEHAMVPSQEMWAVEVPPTSPVGREPPPRPASATIGAVRGPLDLGIEGVRARALGIASETPYQTLGLPEGANAEAARAAYFRLSRVWNPTKLPPELEAVRAAVELVFGRMTEAHRLLTQAPNVPGAARS